MRDRDPHAPEILRVGNEPAGDFAEVALTRGGEIGRFRFSVSTAGKAVVQRILATRPFDAMPGLTYRYFYAGQGGQGSPVRHLLYVRVEQGMMRALWSLKRRPTWLEYWNGSAGCGT